MIVRKHIETRNAINAIPRKDDLRSLLDGINIDPMDREIMRMRYEEKKSWDYIADTIGYSLSTVKRRHARILNKISKII